MKQYEKNLKYLIALSKAGSKMIHQNQAELTEDDLRFLSAKGLISLKPAGDNEFWIVLEPAGITYFSDQKSARENFIKDKLITFVSGFVSGVLVTVVATWIIQALL